MHRRGLADRADIVVLAFDGEDRGTADRAGIDRHAMRHELAARQRLAMKDAIDGLQIEIRRKIHHRRVFVVEFPRRVGAFDIALDQMLEELDMRVDVPVEIHAEKAGELHEAGIDSAEGAGIAHRHDADDIALEPLQRMRLGEAADLSRRDARIDRPAHQCQGLRLRRVVCLRE